MKFYNIAQVNEFKNIINNASGKVWAEDAQGASFDLKSELSQYIVIGKILSNPENNLLLYTSDYNDEAALLTFLSRTQEKIAA